MAGGVHPDHFKFKDLTDLEHLGFSMSVRVENSNEADLQTLMPHLFQELPNGQKIAPSYEVRMKSTRDGSSQSGYLLKMPRMDVTGHKSTKEEYDRVLYDHPPTSPGRNHPDPEIARKGTLIDNIDDRSVEPITKTLEINGENMKALSQARALGDYVANRSMPEQSMSGSREDMMKRSQRAGQQDEKTIRDQYIDNQRRKRVQMSE
jgi:hypothetical protein